MIVLIGESGAGKTTIEKLLETNYGMTRIISYTTRRPRPEEVDGVDYHFVSFYKFNAMLEDGQFAEHDIYSQGRMYGTLKKDYVNPNSVAVLTPNGLRSVMENMPKLPIISVYVTANLSTRMIRYIQRCGDAFNFDDKNEISARVERDYGMFLGARQLCSITVTANGKAEDALQDLIIQIKNHPEFICPPIKL